MSAASGILPARFLRQTLNHVMTMKLIEEFEYHLNALETALRQTKTWPEKAPSKEQLASTAPFAIDTLSFFEWLAYVFVPKCHHLIAIGQLPRKMAISPAAQMYVPNCPESILVSLLALDKLTEPNKK
ncbi:YqcC family protein [Alteromonas sp. 1_MG-2023]|uniref:YqcC family protein n=1 Tax=Alteromonas sp. 1_MG-2023 TaxID=3062669 RepID=UPI0026E35523|nr:YqcC family protein [Alteromonas sp. 1_MG-2023]MDO6565460.1 YqcC family protein [Alteromonas sp. 1_MG-2023]